jgi:hypothetical protein
MFRLSARACLCALVLSGVLAGGAALTGSSNADAQPKKTAPKKGWTGWKKKKPAKAETEDESKAEDKDKDKAEAKDAGGKGKGAGTEDIQKASAASGGGPQVVETKSTGDAGVKTYKFGPVEVEGRLKSPQVVYFMRRVRAEFAAGALGHRSFMRELSDTRRGSAFR